MSQLECQPFSVLFPAYTGFIGGGLPSQRRSVPGNVVENKNAGNSVRCGRYTGVNIFEMM